VTEAESFALQTIISEFRNISPEITNAFLFKKNGEVIARIEPTALDLTAGLISAFHHVGDKANGIGGIENLSIQAADSELTVVSMSDRFLATVSSRSADPRVLKALTSVVVPTVVKLVDQTAEESAKIESCPKEIEQIVQEARHESVPVDLKPPVLDPEPPAIDSPSNQLMVEKIAGLLVAPDIVRVDADLVEKWSNVYGDKRITQVLIKTFEGRAVICKFRSAKGGNGSLKGTVQIPEKILEALQTNKGNLVTVKPVAK